MNDDSVSGYRHTQNGPWFLLLLVPGVLMLGFVWVVREEPFLPIVLAVAGTLMLVLGASFRHLTVADEGERLTIRFGPLALFQKRIRYADIVSVEVGRTTLLDG